MNFSAVALNNRAGIDFREAHTPLSLLVGVIEANGLV
jgi:hypothetical protein